MIPKFIREPNPEIYLGDNYIVLDFETTNCNKGDSRDSSNRLILTSYYTPSGGFRTNWGSEYRQSGLLEAISSAEFLVAHNTKFELGWLKRCGASLSEILGYDTLLGEYVLDGNRKRPRDLDSIAERYGLGSKGELVSNLIKKGVCPSEIPRRYLERYCIQDVNLTHQIFLKQRQLLQESGLLPTAFTRNIFTPVLVDIEHNGMCLDCSRVKETNDKLHEELLGVSRDLSELTGGINIKSTQQVAHFIYEELKFEEVKDRRGRPIRGAPNKQFPEGQPRTDEKTLASLKATNKRQRRFLELKKRASALNTSIDRYMKLFLGACENGGLLYGNFNQAVTQTHRLSSSRPNFQNFDRDFKPLFRARRTEWKVGDRDASQLEFRVAAFLGGDEEAYRTVRNHDDVHSYTASIIECSRQDAKAHTFKPLYGGQSGTKAQQRYYRAFKEKYRGIAETQEAWVYEVLKDKERRFRTATGLIFYYPGTKVTSTGYITNTANIYNYPVQSLATAEIVPIASTYVWHRMKEEGLESFIVNTVHDSIITEETEEESNTIDLIVQDAFTKYVIDYLYKVYNLKFDIPLETETKIGEHWNE